MCFSGKELISNKQLFYLEISKAGSDSKLDSIIQVSLDFKHSINDFL